MVRVYGLCRLPDSLLLGLVVAKLSVAGNDRVDLSDVKTEILRGQIETQLRPVLRVFDYKAFDLDRVILVLHELVHLCQPS